MDLEKYSHLWTKDSDWMLKPGNGFYHIFRYDEKGNMVIPQIEDELYAAVVSRMKSEGVRTLTKSEADKLFEEMRAMQRNNAEKSRKLIEQAAQALEGNQFIKNALRELLNNLDEVADKHPEVHDTAVREILCETILHYFVRHLLADDFPSDTYYAMFSDKGNVAVHKALVQFLTHHEVKVAREKLTTPEERLVVFQDDNVKSAQGNHYDSYFGWVSSL